MLDAESMYSGNESLKLPNIVVNDLVSILEKDTLLDIYKEIQDNQLHGIVFTSQMVRKETEEIITSLASYVFDGAIRLRNLGIHIDSPDRPESSEQILTGFYSPTDNSSNVPTICVDTEIVDQKARAFFKENNFQNKYPQEFDEIRIMILDHLKQTVPDASEDSLGFWTSMSNIFFAHRGLNEKYQGAFLSQREEFTRDFLKKFSNELSAKRSEEGQECLFLIPNGTSNTGRKVAHTRFSMLPEEDRYSYGMMSNIIINYKGEVSPTDKDVQARNPKIEISEGLNTMTRRSSIDPRERLK